VGEGAPALEAGERLTKWIADAKLTPVRTLSAEQIEVVQKLVGGNAGLDARAWWPRALSLGDVKAELLLLDRQSAKFGTPQLHRLYRVSGRTR
jgi:hypothetical protein